MRSLLLPFAASLACLLISPAVSADSPAPTGVNEINPTVPRQDIEKALAARDRRFFIGALGGVAWATASHPQLLTSRFVAPTLGLHAGYAISPHWAIALELTTIEKSVTRATPSDLFSAASVQPQAGCLTPCPTQGGTGGELLRITALFGTIAPRVEVTPFGRDGLYFSGSGGLAFIQGLDARAGFGGTARAGFRLRAAEVVTFSVEAGFQGQTYADASAIYPYGAVLLRPYF
jgi:hypothetical protein